MNSNLVGETAAILTSCLWTGSSILFTSAGRRIGSLGVNVYRTTIAIGLLLGAHAVLLGVILPIASSGQWFWMGLSGIIGLGIGDFGLFAAYVTIGPRRTVLIQSSAPIFASIGACLMLGETFKPWSIIGIAVTLSGIFVVVLERQETMEEKSVEMLAAKKRRKLGIFFGLISAIGQGFGLVLTKKGLYLGVNVAMNPLSAALIRMLFAGLFVWACAVFAGKLPALHNALKNREGIKYTAAGALIGPFIGMTLSIVAVANSETGIAQTLMSLTPIFIIPVVWVIYREKTNLLGMAGAILAVAGIGILLLT